MVVTGLVPARFLTIIAHLVITIVILWSRKPNIESCLPVDYTDKEYDDKELQLIIGLSISLALFVLELVGFLSGTSMFMHTQGLISIAAHASAAVTLSFFIFEEWECDAFWYVFGFCSALPALTEVLVIIGVTCFGKRL